MMLGGVTIATIKEVAQLAGVSPATVSRVVTNKKNISHETREKVLLAMQQLNYIPNANAQSLSSDRSNTIGFVIARKTDDDHSSFFFNHVLFGISEAANQHQYFVQFTSFPSMTQLIDQCVKLYRKKQVDGFIFTSILSSDKAVLLKRMNEEFIPFVIIGSSLSHNVFSIHNDNIRDSFIATKHLIDQGYKHTLLLTPDIRLDVMRDRVHGFQRALEEHGLENSPNRIVICNDSESDITKALDQVRNESIPFDSILTMDSTMSLSVLKYCLRHGMTVPDDVGVLCFNDAPYLTKTNPTISCIDTKPKLLGFEAFHMLMDIIHRTDGITVEKSITLPSEIIVRQSTCRA